MTMAGSPMHLDLFPVHCTSVHKLRNVRCCVDGGVKVSSTVYGCSGGKT